MWPTVAIVKVTYSYPKVTYSYPRVTYSDPKVTYSYPTLLGGGGWVTTNFNVSFELFRLEGHPLPILA